MPQGEGSLASADCEFKIASSYFDDDAEVSFFGAKAAVSPIDFFVQPAHAGTNIGQDTVALAAVRNGTNYDITFLDNEVLLYQARLAVFGDTKTLTVIENPCEFPAPNAVSARISNINADEITIIVDEEFSVTIPAAPVSALSARCIN